MFQSYNLIPTLTAQENIALARNLNGAGKREAAARARELLVVGDFPIRQSQHVPVRDGEVVGGGLVVELRAAGGGGDRVDPRSLRLG